MNVLDARDESHDLRVEAMLGSLAVDNAEQAVELAVVFVSGLVKPFHPAVHGVPHLARRERRRRSVAYGHNDCEQHFADRLRNLDQELPGGNSVPRRLVEGDRQPLTAVAALLAPLPPDALARRLSFLDGLIRLTVPGSANTSTGGKGRVARCRYQANSQDHGEKGRPVVRRGRKAPGLSRSDRTSGAGVGRAATGEPSPRGAAGLLAAKEYDPTSKEAVTCCARSIAVSPARSRDSP